MYSQLFLQNPEQFAATHALTPTRSAEDTSKLKPKQVDPNLTLYQVKGANRILFAKIDAAPPALNCYDVLFSETQLSNDWFPVYWLPWHSTQTYRITLKPSLKHVVLGLDGNAASPRHFFTASLTGCMVHVEGDPQAPTVYHGNAIGAPTN